MPRRTLATAALAALILAVPAAVAPAKSGRDFPVTIKAANGSVTIEQRPARIVSLSPTATEMLYAVGAGRQVIAVDDQSNYPVRAPQTKLSGHRPNAEAVARYRPDLVIASSSTNKLLPALKKLRIPVLLAPAATRLGGAYAQLRQIGRATGHDRGAATVVRRMKRAIMRAVRSVPRGHALKVFHELSPDFYSATSRTFIGHVYTLFGLRNIADEASKAGIDYPQLSAEYILAANPDLVVLADTKCCKQTPASVRKRPGWSSLSAVRSGRVVGVDEDLASRWGPRIVRFVELVARTVRGARS